MRIKKPNPLGSGRKPGWTKKHNKRVYNMALLGLTQTQMAECLGISPNVFDYWKMHYPSFANAVDKGRTDADGQVAKALFKRAIGYTAPDTHIGIVHGKVVKTPIKKHYPPDAWACLQWLKLRQKELWREKNIDFSATLDISSKKLDLSDISTEELLMAKRLGVKMAEQAIANNN